MPTSNARESIPALLDQLVAANTAYRAGRPILSDPEYDHLAETLRDLEPHHPYLHGVEPEPDGLFSGTKIHHKTAMLSTEKAYASEDLVAFFRRIDACAQSLGIDPRTVTYTANAKLDGLSGRLYLDHTHTRLSTRGNGLQGNDISEALSRGLVIDMDESSGAPYVDGEIVLDEDFFQEYLRPLGFKHARNFMVGFVGADTIKDHHLLAGKSGKAQFVAYTGLDSVSGTSDHFLERIEDISEDLRHRCAYATDGVVISVDDPSIRAAMGATSHHHRWQIAFKTQTDSEETRVLEVHWQTGRTGRVTPVIEVEPVELSGATVRRATAHTACMIEKLGIGPGAVVRLVRAGEVIPKIVDVVERAKVLLPDVCPSCGHPLEADGEYLLCPSIHCKAQAEGRIAHFFKTLGNADGFGPKAVEKIIAYGITELPVVMKLTETDFICMGFGPGQAVNLQAEIDRCVKTPIEDWRFLAAFGIRHLGRGDSRHLLAAIGGLDALAGLSWETIAAVDGFAEKTARSIAEDLAEAWSEIQEVRASGFQIMVREQPASAASAGWQAFEGLALVFTGTFSVPREDLEEQARSLGAQVQSAVNKKTSALVIGEKPGNSKVSKAQALGVPTWTEAFYREARGPLFEAGDD
ncbi:NAD-dependent DNA ligase [Acidithiobacillus sp. MC6.1]|nr:NAD-dependent DNA ligase [Acidithiobacillus sp. MC6.1]